MSTAPTGFYDGLGASLCAAIMGEDSHRSPYDVWNEFLHPEARPNLDENEIIEAGHIFEPAIARWAAKRWGLEIDYNPDRLPIKHPTLPFMQCHPDALIVGEPAGMEIKNRGLQMLRTYRSLEMFEDDMDRAQPSEVLQSHACMAVTGAERWYLAVGIGGQKLLRFIINRDEAIVRAIEEAYARMWEHIQRRIPPPPINRDDCRALWPGHMPGKIIVASDDLAEVCAKRSALKAQIKALNDEVEFCELQIMREMKDAEELHHGGKKILSWRQQSRGEYVVKASSFRVMR